MSSKYLDQATTKQEQIELRVGNVYLSDLHVRGNYVNDDVPTVVQAGAIGNAVILSNETGRITTVASNLAAGASTSFQLTNTAIAANDRIEASLIYAGTGLPMVDVRVKAAGAAEITLFNADSTDALNAALNIVFRVYRYNLA